MTRRLTSPLENPAAVFCVPIDHGGTATETQQAARTALHALSNDRRNIPGGFLDLDASALIPLERVPFLSATIPTIDGPLSVERNETETYAITNYDVGTLYTLTAIDGTVSRVDDEITYIAPDNPGTAGFIINEIPFSVEITGVGIARPAIVLPVSGAVRQLFAFQIKSTPFVESTGTDTHTTSTWQLATDTDFSTIVSAAINDTTYKTHWLVSGLALNTTYYVRVRYTGDTLGDSAWSAPIHFKTKATQYPTTEGAKILPTTKSNSQNFGWNVMLSQDGTSAIVTAVLPLSTSQALTGAAYAYTLIDGVWERTGVLTPSDAGLATNFGSTITISGDGTIAALAGHTRDGLSSQIDAGAVYMYAKSGNTWLPQQVVRANDATAYDYFGQSIALDYTGTTLVTLSTGDDTANGADNGSFYVFTRTGDVWTQKTKIVPAAGSWITNHITISGNGTTIAVGAGGSDVAGQIDAGAVYIYQLTNDTWAQQAKLVPSDNQAYGMFGNVVQLTHDGNMLLVTKAKDNTANGIDSGSAYIFTRSGTTWTQQAKLLATDGAAGDRFGVIGRINVLGTLVFIGADLNDTQHGSNAGTVYVFERTGATWQQVQTLYAGDGATDDQFGRNVAINHDGSALIAPAWYDDNESGVNAGSFYYFT